MILNVSPSEGAGARDAGCARAPRMIIDSRGREVGVLIGYAEYVALLAHLSAHAAPAAPLPAYWRRALAAWIPE